MIIEQGTYNYKELPDWLNVYWFKSLEGSYNRKDYDEDKDHQNFYYSIPLSQAKTVFGHHAGNYGPLELKFYEDGNGIVHYKIYSL
jgi:hypothetical protein